MPVVCVKNTFLDITPPQLSLKRFHSDPAPRGLTDPMPRDDATGVLEERVPELHVTPMLATASRPANAYHRQFVQGGPAVCGKRPFDEYDAGAGASAETGTIEVIALPARFPEGSPPAEPTSNPRSHKLQPPPGPPSPLQRPQKRSRSGVDRIYWSVDAQKLSSNNEMQENGMTLSTGGWWEAAEASAWPQARDGCTSLPLPAVTSSQAVDDWQRQLAKRRSYVSQVRSMPGYKEARRSGRAATANLQPRPRGKTTRDWDGRSTRQGLTGLAARSGCPPTTQL